MTDRPSYEAIVREIGRRRAIIGRVEVRDEGKGDQWGAKLEDLCDGHLKKMQKANLLDDLPVGYGAGGGGRNGAGYFDFMTGESSEAGKGSSMNTDK